MIEAKEQLVKKLRQILPTILNTTPVTLAYLYGSRATDQSLPSSDVDIALVLGQKLVLSPKERLNLEFTVEGELQKSGILKPDVRVIDDLPLTFRGEVATQGIRLYARDETVRVEFETRTWKEYLDFKPVIQMMQQAFIDQIRQHGFKNGQS